MLGEMLINFGSEVKADADGKVSGYLITFTGQQDPDLARDYFTKSTDFGVDEWPSYSSVYYDHAQDTHLKLRRLARASLKMDDAGIWAEAQLSRRDAYEEKIYELARKGKLGWSSGTAAHLVEREADGEAKRIVSWPLGLDASLTPTPCEPRNVVSVKSYYEGLAAASEVADLASEEDSVTIRVEEIKTVRQFEQYLRDDGWPNAAAVTIASHGFKALVRRDSGERVSEADLVRLDQIRFAAQRRLRTYGWLQNSSS
jgi:hypothetical protein